MDIRRFESLAEADEAECVVPVTGDVLVVDDGLDDDQVLGGDESDALALELAFARPGEPAGPGAGGGEPPGSRPASRCRARSIPTAKCWC